MSMHNFHFWVQDHKLWSGPPVLTSGGNLGNSFFFFLHILSNDMCKFAINLSASAESHLKNVNLLFFLLEMQIWNGCNALNIAGNPNKRCQCKTFISEFRITSCGVDPPVLTSGRHLGNSFFACTLQWYVQICHEPLLFFSIENADLEMAVMHLIL